MKYILHTQSDYITSFISSTNTNNYLNKEILENIELDIPDYVAQEEIEQEYEKLLNILSRFDYLNQELDAQIKKVAYVEGKPKKLKDIFFIYVGTPYNEEHYYNNRGNIPLISSQTINKGILAYVNKSRKIFDFPECLTWCIDGKAGTLFYRNYKFDSTHHAGILVQKRKKEIRLKWFQYTYQQLFLNSASVKAGNGKLGKETVENLNIILPDYETQEKIEKEYEKLFGLKEQITKIKNEIKTQLKKRIKLSK